MFPFAIIPPFIASGKETIKQVAASSYNTMVLTNKGNVYVTGQNRIGELGVGDTATRYNQWVLVLQGINWIAARRETLLAIRKDGAILTPDMTSSSPTAYTWQVDTASGSNIGSLAPSAIKKVWSDSESVYLLKSDNSLWYLGNNSKGQAGNGTTTLQSRFIKTTDDVVDIAIGGSCVVVKKSDGYLWGWGSNSRSVIAASGTTLSPTRMFGTNADGTTITDFTLAGDQAILVRYSDGKYRTKGLNMGQLPSGTAAPGATLTDVPAGYTPGNGTEPLMEQSSPMRNDGTYPNWIGIFYHRVEGEFINCGQATGYMTGVNKASGTVDTWTVVDSASDRIADVKGMSFGLGWVLAYNDTQILYWGSTGSTTVIPIVGYILPGSARQAWVGKLATPPITQ